MPKKLYWDDVNGKVTDDDKWAEIYTFNGCNYYCETYELRGRVPKSYIDWAYTKEQKRMGTYYEMRSHLERHGVKESELGNLVRLCVPEDVYKNALENYSYLLDERSETDEDSD